MSAESVRGVPEKERTAAEKWMGGLRGRAVTIILDDAELDWLRYNGTVTIYRQITPKDVR